ncbi:MAG: endo-1,4-beta-xylanase [Planctomycetota bacterium]
MQTSLRSFSWRVVSIWSVLLTAGSWVGVTTSSAETEPVTLEQSGYTAYAATEAAEARLPEDARLMIVGDVEAFDGPGAAAEATLSIIDVAGQPFDRAVRVELTKVQSRPWDALIKTPSNHAAIEAGDVIFGVFYVRADSDDESATGSYQSFLQRDVGEWEGLSESGGLPGGAWSRRVFRAQAERDYPAGTVNYVFQMGTKVQALEVGGFAAWNLGPDADLEALPVSRVYYLGQEPDAAWRGPAQERIEQIRKANLTVKVVDAEGRPVEGADVHIELDRHAFGFGTWLGIYGPLLDETPDGVKFREIVTTYYNRLTTPVYPAQTWGWPDPKVRARNLRYMKWATDTGFPTRAHVVLWSAWDRLPTKFYELRDQPDELNQAVLTHVEDVMGTIREFPLSEVDFQNETRNNHIMEDAIGREDARIAWWQKAAEVAPDLRLAVNEYGIISGRGLNEFNHRTYEEDIQMLLDAGVPVGVIGMQGHIGEDFTDIEQLKVVFDRFAKFGLPIHVTEFDVATLDEQTKADYLRDFYTMAFSHPAVTSVTQWGFWEPEHWKPQAALWSADWTPTPAGEAYMKLITETFHTDMEAVTGGDGVVTGRGFKGIYTVTVTKGRQRVTLTPTLDEDATVTVTLE